MSRVGWPKLMEGWPRSLTGFNAWARSVETASGALDADNFAAEGLDLRNLAAKASTDFDGKIRTMYKAWSGPTALAANGAYGAEGIVPLVMTTNVELDLTALPIVVSGNDVLIIEGILACGYHNAGAFVDGVLPTANTSCTLIVDSGAGYVRQSQTRRRISGTASQVPMRRFDLTMIRHWTTAGSIRKIGISYGSDVVVNVNRAQLSCYLLKRVR